jgi:hypothetical protein
MDAGGAGLRDRNARMMRAEPPSRQRCGARLKCAPGNFCARYVAPGKTRCNLHGGKSTGRVSQQGSRLSTSPRCTRAAAAGQGA